MQDEVDEFCRGFVIGEMASRANGTRLSLMISGFMIESVVQLAELNDPQLSSSPAVDNSFTPSANRLE